MRFTVDREPMLAAVARVRTAAGNAKSIPIVGMVRLVAGQGRVTVTATDLTLEASAEATATVAAAGEVCAPVDQLHDLVSALPEGAELSFGLDPPDPRLAVAAGRARFKLPTLPASDFPARPEQVEGEVCGTIKAQALARLIDKTLFAVSTDAARLNLHGMHLHVIAGAETVIRAVATSGMKLAYAEAPCPEGLDRLAPLTIPTRLATEVRRWLGDLTLDVEIRADARRLELRLGSGRLRGQLLAGAYVDYQRVLPEPGPHRAVVDVAAFKAACRRAIIAAQATEQTRMKAIRLELAPGVITFSGRSMERGEAQEEIEVDYDGPEIAVAFNSAHLLEIADRVSSLQLELVVADALGPSIVFDPSDPALLLLTMPVRG